MFVRYDISVAVDVSCFVCLYITLETCWHVAAASVRELVFLNKLFNVVVKVQAL